MASDQEPTKTLLIVEDDKGLQTQLRWHFNDYNVITAGDREAAIDALRMHEPSVVLQDLGLPPPTKTASSRACARWRKS